MTTVKGIDVSAYQPNVNFAQVKASGIEVVYIKATEGTAYINPLLDKQYQGAKAAGLKVGFYHFIHPSTVANAQAQAQYFVSAVGGMAYDCPLVMDIELNGGLTKPELDGVALAFLREISALTGSVLPVVYTYTGFIAANLTSALAAYPLWLADYNATPSNNPVWPSWAGWQHSQSGSVAGVNGAVDMDEFTTEIAFPAVTIIAGTTTIEGKLINGGTWGPVAAICRAKGIACTWDAAKKIAILPGVSDAALPSGAPIIATKGSTLAGWLVGGSTWGPVAPMLKDLGIPYTWDATTNTLKF